MLGVERRPAGLEASAELLEQLRAGERATGVAAGAPDLLRFQDGAADQLHAQHLDLDNQFAVDGLARSDHQAVDNDTRRIHRHDHRGNRKCRQQRRPARDGPMTRAGTDDDAPDRTAISEQSDHP